MSQEQNIQPDKYLKKAEFSTFSDKKLTIYDANLRDNHASPRAVKMDFVLAQKGKKRASVPSFVPGARACFSNTISDPLPNVARITVLLTL